MPKLIVMSANMAPLFLTPGVGIEIPPAPMIYGIACYSCGESAAQSEDENAVVIAWNMKQQTPAKQTKKDDPKPAPDWKEQEKVLWDKFMRSVTPGDVHELDPKATLLDKAREICTGDRRKDYGGALENHEKIADLWRVYLGERPADDITAEDVAVMMVLVKVSRLATSPTHYDSMVDIAGYAAVMNEIRETRAQKRKETGCA